MYKLKLKNKQIRKNSIIPFDDIEPDDDVVAIELTQFD